MIKRFLVTLTHEEIQTLQDLLQYLRQRFVEDSFEFALQGKPRGHRPRALQGEDEARLIALASEQTPDGQRRWSLRALVERWATTGKTPAPKASPGRPFAASKKSELKPWQHEEFVIPPEGSAAFVAAMEDVLDVYKRPVDPKRPLVCLDECSQQRVREVRKPIPAAPGQPTRYDYEHVRHGTSNVFMISAPLRGWRRIAVTERRTRLDWAEQIRRLAEEDFPNAEKIVLVMDNPSSIRLKTPVKRIRVFAALAAAKTPLD